LLVTEKCGSYCRYCFRKRLVGKESDEIAPDFAAVAAYMRNHPEMNNVLLSGGDPFALNTHKLHRIIDHLLTVPNLTSIRFGTKMVALYSPRFADPELPGLFGRIMSSR
jgi:L-lysine 2,3-aminomutase